MKRLLVYSHDTFGLGNIRRMLCICEHLNAVIPDLSILLVSGSPMVHSFRLPPRLDYIKLPCLRRTLQGGYMAKSVGTPLQDTVRLRADLIRTAVTHFCPHLLLVDKKPYGVENELQDALSYLRTCLPETRQVLLLRDILDSPEVTTGIWKKQGYYEAIQAFYDLVLVVGTPQVFDLRTEYQLPPSVANKVRFCGYLQRTPGSISREAIRRTLQLQNERLILVTPGGGEDGYHLLSSYLEGLKHLPADHNTSSLIISGPEMPALQKTMLAEAADSHPHVQIREFTNDMMSHIGAADVVVSMGGYNTICEILSLHKRAVVVPRVQPVAEQWIRAQRLARLGLLAALHPAEVTPRQLMHTVLQALQAPAPVPARVLDFHALPRIASYIAALLTDDTEVDAMDACCEVCS